MKYITLVIVLSIIGGNVINNSYIQPALQPIVYAAEPEEPRVIQLEVVTNWTRARIEKEIDTQAAKYGVSAEVMRTVVQCESQYNIKALGDGGHSRGLVQIHSGYHDVSDEDAYDPRFALDFLAKHLQQGKGNLWSCYRMHY
jgi:hypothetical protein